MMIAMPEKFRKPYNPQIVEKEIYGRWETSGFFNPDVCIAKGITNPDAPVFSMVLPPPNVTGTLHIGSALMLDIEDIVIRYKRMRGFRTLWLPGTDHAAIATQSKVEKDLYKEGKTRHDFNREDFITLVQNFALKNKYKIKEQMVAMGASLDWSREAFTLDEKRVFAVRTAFTRMYEAGLIFRGERIVNWDPKLQTTIADDEIGYREQKDPFYYFQYGPFVIGTARPETKFGDKYVVMHPEDTRYSSYSHGQQIKLEWINGPIVATIIKDPAIDMTFGSGVMTITPAHSAIDFDIAQRHKLDIEQVINFQGKLLPIAGEFAGMHIKKARSLIVEKLEKKGLVVQIDENYIHNVAINSRGEELIEPQIKMQWFIDVAKKIPLPFSHIEGIKSGESISLKEAMLHVVRSGQITILPEQFEKHYFSWIENFRPWCISRQISYGHRIPVWYRKDEVYVGVDAPTEEGWKQDEDTLDTWFSSALWTFSTLGWPEDTPDLHTYHPTSLLETGYDILFFWVARMILMSIFHLGEIPFRTVYLHGIVRNEKGQKLSKSLNNAGDPLKVIETYGTDALRMALIVSNGPGNDFKLQEEKIKAYKHFANKLWNIARFILEHAENGGTAALVEKDLEYHTEFNTLTVDVTADMEGYRFHLAAEKLYHYLWDTFASNILEESKVVFKNGDPKETTSRKVLLLKIFTDVLKLLHPFMPFITEEIWSAIPDSHSLLMVEKWPFLN